MVDSKECSVIQGSKLSSLLYIVYTNEVPKLHELLADEEWVERNLNEEVTKFKEINHVTANFIDDSNSVNEFEDPTELLITMLIDFLGY